jgi:hypothetical protein
MQMEFDQHSNTVSGPIALQSMLCGREHPVNCTNATAIVVVLNN